ncbi:negative elongation factor E [Nilaparvata lugens]|uniref:negative elongation factor E n=1 Tax=Nilaparvata lugens TaxID=108931 RepID=UPI00193C90FA|nr:negative elongation factor E [Nilaparvata lugens]
MVYLHFPNHHTEEELMLQAKYHKLKRKKKALQALKSPRVETERTPTALSKRPIEARDAREVAKKLIKSGAIPAIAKTPKRPEQAGFKRPRGLEKKLSGSERMVSGFQPFSATQPEDQEADVRPRVKNLYESMMSARDKEEGRANEKVKEPGKPDKPRQGNTIFVSGSFAPGSNITEDLLKKAFQPCGNIVNISMEVEKNRGFVTFDKTDAAERAIAEVNGSMVSGVPLKVTLARRQVVIEPINDVSSSSAWCTIAANSSQKGGHKDKRALVSYENDPFEGGEVIEEAEEF